MTKMNVTEIRKGDVVRFKHYALRIETEPKTNGAFVEFRGRQSTDGCPLVTKKLNISMVVSVDRNLTTSSEDVEECLRCQGSGEIGVDIRGRFERAGPVPDDAKGFAIATCWNCKGTGYIEKVS